MNIIALLSLALLMGSPMLQGAEEQQYQREREAKRSSQARNIEAEVKAVAAQPVTTVEAETIEDYPSDIDLVPLPYPEAQLRLKDLQSKIERLGQEAISPKEREALRRQGKDVASEIRKAGLKKLSDTERELYDILLFGDIGEGLQGMIGEYLTGWHEVGQFKGHEGVVNALATYWDIREGTNKLVSGGQDGTVRIWDILTQKCKYTLAADPHPVTALTVLVPENYKKPKIIAAAYGTYIKLFTLQKNAAPTLTKILSGNPSPIIYLNQTADADRNMILSSFGAQDRNMRYWNVATSQFKIENFVAPLLPYGADKPGLFSANYVNRTTQCLALPTHTPTAFSHLVNLKWNRETNKSEQTLFASGDANGTIYVWNLENSACIATLHGHTAKITALQLLQAPNLSISKFYDVCTCTCPECASMIQRSEKEVHVISCYEGHCQPCKEATLKKELAAPETLQLISASEDGTVRLWEMSEGKSKLFDIIKQEKEFAEISSSDDEGCGCTDEYTKPGCECSCHNESSDSDSDDEDEDEKESTAAARRRIKEDHGS